MVFSSASKVRLIDEALADELFGLQKDADITCMQQQIWREMRDGIGPDLEKALAGAPEDLRTHLHRIRGYCSSCALSRLEKLLLAWESEPVIAEAAERYAALARETASLSIAAIETRYPQLKTARGKTSR